MFTKKGFLFALFSDSLNTFVLIYGYMALDIIW